MQGGDVMPAQDGGYGWVCVVAGFIARFLLSGQTRSFGILLAPLMDAFNSTAALTVWINGIMFSFSFMFSPFTSVLVNRFGHSKVICLGGFVAGCGLTLSYVVVDLWYLFITYGFLLGIGCGLTFNPVISIIPLYFKKRLSSALGLLAMGSIIGGAAFPYLVEYLLNEFNWNGSLLISGAIIFNVCAMGLLIKAPNTRKISAQTHTISNNTENEVSEKTKERQFKFHWEVLRDKRFIAYILLIGTNMGYFQVFTLLPLRTEELEDTALSGAASVTALAFADAATRMLWAFLWDVGVMREHKSRQLSMAVLCLICGAVLICVGLTSKDLPFIIAVFLMGVLMSGTTSLFSPILADLVGPVKFGSAFGAVFFFQAIAMLIVPVITGYLLDVTGTVSASLYLLGSMYVAGCPVSLLLFYFDQKYKNPTSANLNQLGVNGASTDQLTINAKNDLQVVDQFVTRF